MKKSKLSCKNKGIGLGADDINGCYLLLQIMLKRPNGFIFCAFDLEEMGCIGSKSFNVFPIQDQVSVLIGLDRKSSNEFALYGYESEELLKLLNTFPNYHLGFGSITNCTVLAEESNICCFNLSVGYYKQHSPQEFAIIRDVERAEKFLINLPVKFWGKQFLVDYFCVDDDYLDYYLYDSLADPFQQSLFKSKSNCRRRR